MPEKSQYLYRVQTTRAEMLEEGPTPEEEEIIRVHSAYLKRLTEEGVVLLAGRTLNTDASSFGIVIFEADGDASARAVMDQDPAVAGGVMRAELFPYRIVFTGLRAR